MEKIYPRSPREMMCGWVHLPRYIDKIRLYLAGKLHPDYLPNLGKGYDGFWLKMAGRTHQEMVRVVASSITDGESLRPKRMPLRDCKAITPLSLPNRPQSMVCALMRSR